MVRRHLATRGITDRRVLAVMAAIPREHFLPPYLRDQAYADMPLPIGYDQTISQPYIVALMTQEAELTRQSAVLEIGTGTGYHTAVLARIARHVWTVERLEALSRRATRRLDHLAVRNVTFVTGDGALGYPDAGPPLRPVRPRACCISWPSGEKWSYPSATKDYEGLQQLTVIDRTETGYRERDVAPCRFVPLISKDAFSE
jgi:protein-L-isoaspartate(D-aspartate) O-methyltransferase